MTKPIQKGLHRRALGLGYDNELIARDGYVAGGEGKPVIVFPSPDTVALFDDFLTDLSGFGVNDTGGVPITLDTGAAGLHFYARCTDTGVKGSLVAGTNGVFRITSSATIATRTPVACSKSVLGKQLMWKANQGANTAGRLRLTTRIKPSIVPHKTTLSGDRVGIFVGFTDTISHEVPFHDTGRTGDSGASGVSTADDFVGFTWSFDGDTGWRGVSGTSGSGGANDSGDQQVLLTTAIPTANKWTVLEVELRRNLGDTGGTAIFYIDGVQKGSIASPINPTIGLTPIVQYYDTGGLGTFDIDYINVSAPRDTGV